MAENYDFVTDLVNEMSSEDLKKAAINFNNTLIFDD